MKNLKRTLTMPLVIMAIAVLGAFMTNSAQAGEPTFQEVDGYKLNMNDQCENTEIRCTTEVTSEICTTANDEPLFKLSLSGTSCPQELYKIE